MSNLSTSQMGASVASKLHRKEVVNELWRRGNLSYLLKGKQHEIYNTIKRAEEHITVIACSRRFGKSYCLCIVSIELCQQKPNAVVKYAAPTKTQVAEIVTKIMRGILEDCPPEMMPEWKEARKMYVFPNGSEIHIAATNEGTIETLRGMASDLCIIDEAGSVTELTYCIDSVLSPTTDTTGGKIILASTPNSRDSTHEFNLLYMQPRLEANTLLKFTIYESPLLSPAKIQEIEDRYGKNSQHFKTEYLCEISVDPELMVVPEFIEKESELIRAVPRTPYFNTYVSMDPGFDDPAFVIFAWYDFNNATIVVEDEIIINGPSLTTDKLAELIREKEAIHFINGANLPVPPTLRVSDTNSPILVNDLHRLHNLLFVNTNKDNKDAAINEVRMRFQQGRIAINPRCINLCFHLRSCKWDRRHTRFAHVKENKRAGLMAHHADGVDALIYLVRNVQTHLNPYPDTYGRERGPYMHARTTEYPGAATPFGKVLQQMTNNKVVRR